jgi:hypothetical protein
VTLILTGAAFGAAIFATINTLLRRVHRRVTVSATITKIRNLPGIRRHSTVDGVWENTISVSAGHDWINEEQDTVYIGRHSRNLDPVDTDATEIIDDGPSTGRHSVDNPYRQRVSTEIEEIRWANGDRTVRPLWIPAIGKLRIALIATGTAEYAVIKRPITPFTGLTRPTPMISGKVMDSYYQFTTT